MRNFTTRVQRWLAGPVAVVLAAGGARIAASQQVSVPALPTCDSDSAPAPIKLVRQSSALQQWYALRSRLLPVIYHSPVPTISERESDCRNMRALPSDVFPLDTFVVFPAWAGADLVMAVFVVHDEHVVALSPVSSHVQFLLSPEAWNQLLDWAPMPGDPRSAEFVKRYFCTLQSVATGGPPRSDCAGRPIPSISQRRGGGFTATLSDNATTIAVDAALRITDVRQGNLRSEH